MMALVADDSVTKNVDITTTMTNQDFGVAPFTNVPKTLLRFKKLKIAIIRPTCLLQDKSKKVFLFLATIVTARRNLRQVNKRKRRYYYNKAIKIMYQ